MDATAVLPRPTPAPTSARSAPDVEADSASEEFAAHLPREEPVRPEAKAPTQDEQDTRATPETAIESDSSTLSAKSDDAPIDIASLTAPLAPVVVRPQNSVVTFDLSALVAASTPAVVAPTAAPVTTAPAAAQQASAPTTIIAPDASAALPAAPATADAPAVQSAQADAEPPPPVSAPAKPVDIAALPEMAAMSGEARAAPKLRAGRTDASAEASTDGKPVAATASSPAMAPTKGATKTETVVAVQATNATAPKPEPGAATDGSALSETAPAETRAHRLNDAAGAHGHRATTPATLVAQQIIRRFEGKSTSIEVRLDPPELGRVQVSLDVAADNKVSAVVAAENPATLADLVRSARELERALQEAGLDLDSGGLSFDLADRGQNEKGEGASDSARGSARADAGRDLPAKPASRPFGLESWRGARIDVMV